MNMKYFKLTLTFALITNSPVWAMSKSFQQLVRDFCTMELVGKGADHCSRHRDLLSKMDISNDCGAATLMAVLGDYQARVHSQAVCSAQSIQTFSNNRVYTQSTRKIYQSGRTFTERGRYYYPSGQLLFDGQKTFYPNHAPLFAYGSTYYKRGRLFQNPTGSLFYPNGSSIQRGGRYYYRSGFVAISGSRVFYPNGRLLQNQLDLNCPNGNRVAKINSTSKVAGRSVAGSNALCPSRMHLQMILFDLKDVILDPNLLSLGLLNYQSTH